MAAVVYQLDDVASDEPLEGFVILDTAGRFHPCEFVVRTCDIGSTLGEVLRSCWPRCPQVFPIPSGVSDARDVGDLLRDEVSVRSRMEIAAFGCVMDLVGSDGAVTLVQVESAGAPFASLCLELFEQFGVPVRLAGAG